MYVIDVIVFSRAAPMGALSYRSTQVRHPGMIVTVPLRRSRVRGIVVACVPVAEAKAALKQAHFALSASEVKAEGSLPEAIIEACERIAAYHATTLGSALAALLADTLPEDLSGAFAHGPGYSLEALEAPSEERLARYRALASGIRECKRATLLVLPTLAEVDRYKKALKDLKPVVLTGSIAPARRALVLEDAAVTTGLVITTPAFAFVPIAALGLVILERVSAGTYRGQKRPYLDMAYVLRALAEARMIPCVVGDYPLPLELRPTPAEALSSAPSGTVTVLDMRPDEADQKAQAFKAVPGTMLEAITAARALGGAVAVFASRRGYAPTVVCRDCGTSVTDAEGRVLSYATVRGEKVFRSAGGETIRGTQGMCDVCNSWNLLPLGIGVERVEEELAAAFPGTDIVRFDTDTASTPARARKLMARASGPGAILVGTETLLPWLDPGNPLAFAAIASADSLLALPFWRSRERFVRFGLMLRERAASVMIATRRPDDAALSAVRDPEDPAFFAEEDMLRKALGYPPYAVFVRFEAEGALPALDAAVAQIASALDGFPYTVFPDRPVRGLRMRRVALLRLPEGAWPSGALSNRLARLSPGIRITIDPESF